MPPEVLPRPKVDARFAYIQAESFSFDPVSVEAAADGTKKPRTFRMVGYSGGFMDLGWGHPVVCDIEGAEIAAESIPILIQHGRLGFDQSPLDAVLGHTTKLALKNRITAEGVISGISDEVQKVVDLTANGAGTDSARPVSLFLVTLRTVMVLLT